MNFLQHCWSKFLYLFKTVVVPNDLHKLSDCLKHSSIRIWPAHSSFAWSCGRHIVPADKQRRANNNNNNYNNNRAQTRRLSYRVIERERGQLAGLHGPSQHIHFLPFCPRTYRKSISSSLYTAVIKGRFARLARPSSNPSATKHCRDLRPVRQWNT